MTGVRALARALGRPAVLAHRGASARAPENSLAALRLARELGADGVEFDVQRCATGELVVFHDRTLARCTGALGQVTETPLGVLERLSLDRIDPSAAGARIPTLDAFLEAAPPELFLNLEVKIDELSQAEVARACVRALARAGRARGAIVSSFHPAALACAAAEDRLLARGALVDGSPGWRGRMALGLLTRPVAIHPEHTLVTAARVARWHRTGLAVAAWTVDAPAEVRRCLEAGVDAIITNRPDLVRPLAEEFRR